MDFAGAQELCTAMIRSNSGYPTGQPKAIAWFAAGNAALLEGRHDEALQDFRRVIDENVTPKFFLHWYWRIHAQFGLVNTWLAAGNLEEARVEAGRLLEAALATADPSLQALAWEANARLGLAKKNWQSAEESVQNGQVILEKFEIPTAAWRVDGTAWKFYQQTKNQKAAETHRKRAEACILKIANSFAPEEPLRATFLATTPIRRILGENVPAKVSRQPKLRHGAAH